MRLLIDTHCDTPGRLLCGADLSVRGTDGHFDYPRMAEGGVDCEFFALYTPNDMAPDAALRTVMEMAGAVKDSIAATSGVRLALSSSEIIENKRNGISRMGVRYVTLTHNGNNEVCDAALAAEERWHGLSPFGKEFVSEMNRMGMLVDVSHVSDKSFYDVLEHSFAPVVATHSCCRALSDHPRNMDDGMIRALAEKGGVVQVNFYPLFLDAGRDKAKSSYKRVADHIDHVVGIAGVESVGIGSDFDGIDCTPAGLEDISRLPVLFSELSLRGYSENELDMIAGGNFLRVMKAVEEAKTVKLHE